MLNIDSKKYPKPRSRHHNSSNVYFALHALGAVPKFYPPLIETIDWSDAYINGKTPNDLDLGCGWGSFMLQYADRNKDYNILGLEVRKLPVDWIQEVILGESIANASSVWYSLPNGLPFIADSSISNIFSFFPDPWLKKKHHKRRAFNSSLLHEILRISENKAQFWQMTDVPIVAKHHVEVLSEFPQFHLDSFEFIGEWTDEWNEEFSGVLPFDNQSKKQCIWDIPLTDQEEFSLKKGISYLRTHYTIMK